MSTFFLISCSGTGEIIQSNSNAVTIMDKTGGYGDKGSQIAATHCGSYGKVAVYESGVQVGLGAKLTYLCK